jgi:chromosome segregation ATPase
MERQYQCLRCGHDSRTHECEQIAHAKMVDLQRALDAEREKVKELEAMYRQQLDERDKRIGELAESAKIWMERRNTLQAQLADRDAMILQMGEQAAVLAKENMAVKAQLRQVEGAYQKLLNVIDDSHDEDLPIEIIEARDEAYKFLAAKDAGKGVGNGDC